MTLLQKAAQAVIKHWSGNPQPDDILALRKALEAEQAQAVEPVGYLNLASVKLPGEKHPACEFSYERNNNAAAAIPLYTHPAPPATGERADLIADLRLNHEYCPKEVILFAADMLEADAPKRDKQWHDTAWQRGFKMGVSDAASTVKNATYALAAEQAAHRETNRMMTEALMQSEAQQVAVLEKREPLNRVDILNMHALRCWPRTMFADKSYGIALDTVTVVDFVRIIESHHGIGAKP